MEENALILALCCFLLGIVAGIAALGWAAPADTDDTFSPHVENALTQPPVYPRTACRCALCRRHWIAVRAS